jgi:hypothetical protein
MAALYHEVCRTWRYLYQRPLRNRFRKRPRKRRLWHCVRGKWSRPGWSAPARAGQRNFPLTASSSMRRCRFACSRTRSFNCLCRGQVRIYGSPSCRSHHRGSHRRGRQHPSPSQSRNLKPRRRPLSPNPSPSSNRNPSRNLKQRNWQSGPVARTRLLSGHQKQCHRFSCNLNPPQRRQLWFKAAHPGHPARDPYLSLFPRPVHQLKPQRPRCKSALQQQLPFQARTRMRQ